MTTVTRWFVCSIAAVAIVAPAAADPSGDAAEAAKLFEDGRALAKQGDYTGACTKFAKSLELDHALGTELNLADCNERLGHGADAWRLFETAAVEATRTGDERAAYARNRAEALASKLMAVVVKIPQPTLPNLKVTIGGRNVQPAAEIRDRVDPGEVEVVVTAPTRARFATTARGIAGATVSVDVPAGADESRRDGAVARRRSRVYIAWGLSGGAAASAIASTALIIKAKHDYDHAPGCTHTPDGHITCDDTGNKAIADAQRLGWISTGFAVGAGVLLAGAAVVYFTAPRDSVSVAPIATESTLGFIVAGHF